MKLSLPLGAAALLIAVGLTGCAPALPVVDTEALESSAPSIDPAEEPTDDASADPAASVAAFGETWTYTDGISVTVSAPVEFTPSEFALTGSQPYNVAFEITLANGTDAPFEPFAYSLVQSGGLEAEAVFDSGNEIGDIGTSPFATILPGESITWLEGYNVADPADVTLQLSPEFDYEDAIFTTN